MKAIIASAKTFYEGLKFIGLSADCWTSRAMHGFVTIEITFIYFDAQQLKFVFCRMTLGCIYLPGSHDGPSISIMLKKILSSFGIAVDHIRVYVSDSGGGIPAAAAHLGILRDPCTLHSLDTAVGHALGVKGKHPSPRAARINGLVKAVSAQANVFKNATQKRADYARIAEELRAGALAIDPAATLRRCMVLQTAGNTRMWSHADMFKITAEQDSYVDAYFQREDALNSSRLTPVQRNETGYTASMLQSVAGVQRNLEAGLFVTAAAKWLGPQDVIACIEGSGDPLIMQVMKYDTAANTVVSIPVASLPELSADVRSELLDWLPRYSPTLSDR